MIRSELGGGEQRAFVHAARGVFPFVLRLTAHFPVARLLAGVEKMQGALDGAVFAQLGDVGILRGWGVVLRGYAAAQFFGGEHGVEIAPAGGGFLIEDLRFAAFALRG